jgi:hypothetical protein
MAKFEAYTDEDLVDAYTTLIRLREVGVRIDGESSPWADEYIDEIADEIARRGIKL